MPRDGSRNGEHGAGRVKVIADGTLPITRAERGRVLGLFALRSVVSCVALVVIYSLLPLGGFTPGLSSIIVLCVGAIVFVLIFVWQLRSITRAARPLLRAVEALILSIMLFVIIFSIAYVTLSDSSPGSFSEPLDHIGGLYFTVVTLGTVGYGDIVPLSELARVMVTIQVLLDLAFVAVIVRLIMDVSRRSVASRSSDDSGQNR